MCSLSEVGGGGVSLSHSDCTFFFGTLLKCVDTQNRGVGILVADTPF